MYDQLEARLVQLKAEFEAGQKALAELDAKVTDLKGTLSRLSGAIQVLEEEIGKEKTDDRIRSVPIQRTVSK
jgi:predicted  nucleic acid-binding Zn-ribbon protein